MGLVDASERRGLTRMGIESGFDQSLMGYE